MKPKLAWWVGVLPGVIVPLVLGAFFYGIVSGVSYLGQVFHDIDKENDRKRERANFEAFANPSYVGTLPSGEKIYKIVQRNYTGTDSIYFYDSKDGDRVITTNRGGKEHQNSAELTIEKK